MQAVSPEHYLRTTRVHPPSVYLLTSGDPLTARRMSSRLDGATDRDAESGQPLVAGSNAQPSGSVLQGPVASTLSLAGSALHGLRRAVRAFRAAPQHAGFELVRSADGEPTQQDPDNERDATGTGSFLGLTSRCLKGSLKGRWCTWDRAAVRRHSPRTLPLGATRT